MISNHVGIMNKTIPVIPRLIVSSYRRHFQNDEFLEIEAAQKPEVINDFIHQLAPLFCRHLVSRQP